MGLTFISFDEKVHTDVTFDLLAGRQFSISHQAMPSFEEHAAFCRNHPYRYWYLIYTNDHPVGTCYITHQNSVGINMREQSRDWYMQVLAFVLNNHTPASAKASLIPEYFYINVPPDNTVLESVLNDSGNALIQKTFRL